jgi:hypothetical protein
VVVLPAALVALISAMGRAEEPAAPAPVAIHGRDALGRAFDLVDLRGRIVAVTFASRYTRREASKVNDALSAEGVGGDVTVVSVIDLVGVPAFAHSYARRKAAEADRAGRVRHLVDDGQLRDRFGARPAERVDILIIGRDGSLKGRYAGERELEAALRHVQTLRALAR